MTDDDIIPSELRARLAEMEKKQRVSSRSKHKPTEQERRDLEADVALVNRLNREMGHLVEEGVLPRPSVEGRIPWGGLTDPPAWADRTREARANM